jgi:hypothetical protein
MKVILVLSTTGMGAYYWTVCPACGESHIWVGTMNWCKKCHALFEAIEYVREVPNQKRGEQWKEKCMGHHRNEYERSAAHLRRLNSEGKVDKVVGQLQSLRSDSPSLEPKSLTSYLKQVWKRLTTQS